MIVANRKPFEEIVELIKPYKKILLLGCNECVTVCATGGAKEVEVLASELRMHRQKEGQPIEIKEHVLERNCDPEYVESPRDRHWRWRGRPFHGLRLRHSVRGRALPTDQRVLPAVNTTFDGVTPNMGSGPSVVSGAATASSTKHSASALSPAAQRASLTDLAAVPTAASAR